MGSGALLGSGYYVYCATMLTLIMCMYLVFLCDQNFLAHCAVDTYNGTTFHR
jgi:hypothetical protein